MHAQCSAVSQLAASMRVSSIDPLRQQLRLQTDRSIEPVQTKNIQCAQDENQAKPERGEDDDAARSRSEQKCQAGQAPLLIDVVVTDLIPRFHLVLE